MRRSLIALFIVVAGGTLAVAQLSRHARDASLPAWQAGMAGYAAAVRASAATGKPIALFFYADWCSTCKRLRQDVLSTPEVEAYMRNYLPVQVNPERSAAELALAQSFGVYGYPSIFIVDGADQSVEVPGIGAADVDAFIAACERARQGRSANGRQLQGSLTLSMFLWSGEP